MTHLLPHLQMTLGDLQQRQAAAASTGAMHSLPTIYRTRVATRRVSTAPPFHRTRAGTRGPHQDSLLPLVEQRQLSRAAELWA